MSGDLNRFPTVGAIWENDTDRDGNKMTDQDGNEITIFRMKLGSMSFRLFQKDTKNDPNMPIFDVCFDVQANSFRKKD